MAWFKKQKDPLAEIDSNIFILKDSLQNAPSFDKPFKIFLEACDQVILILEYEVKIRQKITELEKLFSKSERKMKNDDEFKKLQVIFNDLKKEFYSRIGYLSKLDDAARKILQYERSLIYKYY